VAREPLKMEDEHTRYLGTLGLLAECSVYVPEDIREMIQAAFEDACAADAGLCWRRILSRLEIEVIFRQPDGGGDN
jgi:hypothetical protein